MSTETAYDFSFRTITGSPLPLATFKGKAVLVVNTASQCGLTPQYQGLEEVSQHFKDRGLVVLGVPCNDFGHQEPGTEGEIAQFCETQFGVTFPMASKEKVLGDDAHPFYLWARKVLGDEQAPKWNFHKYLIGADGKLAGALASPVKPGDDEALALIEANLPK